MATYCPVIQIFIVSRLSQARAFSRLPFRHVGRAGRLSPSAIDTAIRKKVSPTLCPRAKIFGSGPIAREAVHSVDRHRLAADQIEFAGQFGCICRFTKDRHIPRSVRADQNNTLFVTLQFPQEGDGVERLIVIGHHRHRSLCSSGARLGTGSRGYRESKRYNRSRDQGPHGERNPSTVLT